MSGKFDHRASDFGASGFDGLPDWEQRSVESAPLMKKLREEDRRRRRGPFAPTKDIGMRETILAVATPVASVLYMAGVFVAAIAWGNHVAAIGAVITAGVCYLSYMAQALAADRRVGEGLVILSVVVGVLAGLSLMVW